VEISFPQNRFEFGRHSRLVVEARVITIASAFSLTVALAANLAF